VGGFWVGTTGCQGKQTGCGVGDSPLTPSPPHHPNKNSWPGAKSWQNGKNFMFCLVVFVALIPASRLL